MRKLYLVLLIAFGLFLSGCISDKGIEPQSSSGGNSSQVAVPGNINSQVAATSVPATNPLPVSTNIKYAAQNSEGSNKNVAGSADETNDSGSYSSSSSSIITQSSSSGGTTSSYSSTSQTSGGVTLSGDSVKGYRIDNTNNYIVTVKGSWEDSKGTHAVNEAVDGNSGKNIGKATKVTFQLYRDSDNELIGEINWSNTATTK